MSAALKVSTVTDAQFARVTKLIQEQFGIEIAAHKRPLIAMRLHRVAKRMGESHFEGFFTRHLSGSPSEHVLSELVDRASTNHTFFWREEGHFHFFSETVLPQLEKELSTTKDLRVWCAAAATGEEPVTLAMLVREHFNISWAQWQAGVLATDICASALAHAKAGTWSADNVGRLPAKLQLYFGTEREGKRTLQPSMQADLTWRRLNLMSTSYPFRRPFHVVFCRNVLYYFDENAQREVLQRVHDVMAPGAWLFLSHSESIGRESVFEYVRPGVYRRSQ